MKADQCSKSKMSVPFGMGIERTQSVFEHSTFEPVIVTGSLHIAIMVNCEILYPEHFMLNQTHVILNYTRRTSACDLIREIEPGANRPRRLGTHMPRRRSKHPGAHSPTLVVELEPNFDAPLK